MVSEKPLPKALGMSNQLLSYVKSFQNLRQDHKNGGAPHKPILLLSVLESYRTGAITDNRIYITPEIVSLFKYYWSSLVTTQHDCKFTLPFYHMSSEPFWTLIPNGGCEKWVQSKGAMRSFDNLKTAIQFVEIDLELSKLLLKEESREILKCSILDKYFSSTKSSFKPSGSDGNYDTFSAKNILEQQPNKYRKKLKQLATRLSA